MSDLQHIRGFLQILKRRQSVEIEKALQAYQLDVEADLEEKDWPELMTHFGIQDQVFGLQDKTNKLFAVNYNDVSYEKLFNSYTDIIHDIHKAILYVADRSYLILDPKLETYYLMDLAVMEIPDITEAIAKLRGIGAGILADHIATEEDKDHFHENIAVSEGLINRLNRTNTIIQDISPELRSAISEELALFKSEIVALLKNCAAYPCKLNSTLSAETYFNDTSEMLTSFESIFFTSANLLEERLNQRMNYKLQQIIYSLIATLGAILTIFFISKYYYRQQLNIVAELERVSSTDPLTSIPNRRNLDSIFDREFQRAKRDGKGLAFGILDVDFFKLYNDQYGHHKGDSTLQSVANSLISTLQRGSDFYFRYGGEEFCFLVTAVTQSEVESLVENIRKSIENLAITHDKNLPYRVVTASIGTVFLPIVENETLDLRIKNADMMLYAAKDNGRNCCKFSTLGSDQIAAR